MKQNENNVLYFHKEMAYLREMRELFIEKFPKVAPFLNTDSKDPDVERIIENTANSRIPNKYRIAKLYQSCTFGMYPRIFFKKR